MFFLLDDLRKVVEASKKSVLNEAKKCQYWRRITSGDKLKTESLFSIKYEPHISHESLCTDCSYSSISDYPSFSITLRRVKFQDIITALDVIKPSNDPKMLGDLKTFAKKYGGESRMTSFQPQNSNWKKIRPCQVCVIFICCISLSVVVFLIYICLN